MRREHLLLDSLYEDEQVGPRQEVLSIEQAEMEIFRTIRMGGAALKASWIDDISHASVDWLGQASVYRVLNRQDAPPAALVTRDLVLSKVERFQFPRLNTIKNPTEVHKRDIAFFESENGVQEIMLVSEVTTSKPPKRTRKRKLSLTKPILWPHPQPGFSSCSDAPQVL